MTVLQIADRLRTEADAYRFLEELRWGNSDPVCPHCECIGATYIRPLNGASRKTRTGAMSERRVWRCLACRKQFSVLTGTIFHGTRAPLRTWILVIFEMCASKNGVAAREVARKYGVCPRTAWHMMHRIREATKKDALVSSMRGTIVADETWIGGDPANRHQSRRRQDGEMTPTLIRPGVDLGRVKTDKTIVLSLIDKRTGEVRSRVIPDVTGRSLRKVMAEQVDFAGSHLETDAHPSYRSIGQEFISHQAVDHKSGEYVRNGASTNMAEGFFSQLKRSLDGTHHHVSREHLHRYLAEFDYRHSTRHLGDTHRMQQLMGQVEGRRLTYKRIIHE